MYGTRESIIAFIKQVDEFDNHIIKKFKYIVDISNDSKSPIIHVDRDSWFFKDIIEGTELGLEVSWTEYHCGCCGAEEDYITVPWDVWFGNEEEIYTWRAEVKEKDDAEKKRQESKRKQEELIKKRREIERLQKELENN